MLSGEIALKNNHYYYYYYYFNSIPTNSMGSTASDHYFANAEFKDLLSHLTMTSR